MNHGGGWMGTSTFIERDPEAGLCYIILVNADFGEAQAYLPILKKKFAP